MIVDMQIATWSISRSGALAVHLQGPPSIGATFGCRVPVATSERWWEALAADPLYAVAQLGDSAEDEQLKRELDQMVLSHPHLSKICEDLWGIKPTLPHVPLPDRKAQFGPNWLAVVEILDTLSAATGEQEAAFFAAWEAVYGVDLHAALHAAQGAAWDAGRHAAWEAAGDTALGAAGAAVVWDLATEDGEFTFAQRDLLMASYVSVFGLPASLEEIA